MLFVNDPSSQAFQTAELTQELTPGYKLVNGLAQSGILPLPYIHSGVPGIYKQTPWSSWAKATPAACGIHKQERGFKVPSAAMGISAALFLSQ